MTPVNFDLNSSKLEFNRAAMGMKNPRVVVLPQGEVLYRFCSSRDGRTGKAVDPSKLVQGAWWIDQAAFERIYETYRANSLNLGTIARSAAAVQWTWSDMDLLLMAKLTSDVQAYRGQGSAQYRDVLPNGMTVTLKGWPEIEQIYVPNMRGDAALAFKVLRTVPIGSTDKFGNAVGGVFGSK